MWPTCRVDLSQMLCCASAGQLSTKERFATMSVQALERGRHRCVLWQGTQTHGCGKGRDTHPCAPRGKQLKCPWEPGPCALGNGRCCHRNFRVWRGTNKRNLETREIASEALFHLNLLLVTEQGKRDRQRRAEPAYFQLTFFNSNSAMKFLQGLKQLYICQCKTARELWQTTKARL